MLQIALEDRAPTETTGFLCVPLMMVTIIHVRVDISISLFFIDSLDEDRESHKYEN